MKWRPILIKKPKQMKILKKALAFFIITLLIVSNSDAQQDQTFSQFMFVRSLYNPGNTGTNNAICATGIMKQQWVGLEGAPTVFGVVVESPVKFLKGGLGASIISDKAGSFNTTTLKLNYSYHKKIGELQFAAGLGLGFANKKIDFSYFNQSDDPLLTSTEEESGMIFDIDAGAVLQKEEKWLVGVSSQHLNQGSMEIAGGRSKLARTFYLTGEYILGFRRMPNLHFKPTMLLGYTLNSPLLINAGVIGDYNNVFWGGVMYKHQEGIALMAGVNIKNIKVGYAYDINTNALKNGGSHEIRLGYCFKFEIEKPKRSYKNTRFL